ncbi:hypothetical protein QYM36_009729 [Artemia franciscana]|uniref:Uncharacterized protein n=1 Tax=Artemia franciscana TaxID=6661 RepID=A0AA88I253_ARTSF|nr:hypothetical protein QYM36_009729 [Artemia franciscana]
MQFISESFSLRFMTNFVPVLMPGKKVPERQLVVCQSKWFEHGSREQKRTDMIWALNTDNSNISFRGIPFHSRLFG